MKIILTGYMASGKTSVGSEVARLLNLSFIDLDHYIEKNLNATISDIINEKGEIYFRKIEHHLLNKIIAEENDFVLSLGGGTPCYADNHKVFERSEVESFYLKALPKTLAERLLTERIHRPLVSKIDNENLEAFVAQHLFERSYFYMKAKNVISVEGKTLKEIAALISDYSRRNA